MTHQKIEFIEVTVNKAQLCQASHHAHALLVDLSWIPQLSHLTGSNIFTSLFVCSLDQLFTHMSSQGLVDSVVSVFPLKLSILFCTQQDHHTHGHVVNTIDLCRQ